MKKIFKIAAATVFTFLFSSYVMAASDKSIVDVAAANKDFSTLVTALKAADLIDTLNGSGPFTVFAPTNEAFAKLPKGTLDNLLKDKKQLAAVLTYHVLPGKVMSQDIKNGPATTVQGESVELNKSANGVMVNNAKVVKADIDASNGVIHVIDTVLLPPAK
jgi:uncharacterized surface protein with fasciclin (FAS1) repeats